MLFRWPIRAFGQSRGENVPGSGLTCLLLATQCTQFLPPPRHPPTLPARSGCLSVPFRLLAGALVAYLYSCLLFFRLLVCPPPFFFRLLAEFFLRLLACPSGCLPSFSGCLPGRPAACRAPEVACLLSPAACRV